MLQDTVILLTGATDGIGKQTAFELAKLQATLIMHGKDEQKGQDLKNELIISSQNTNIYYFNADFTSFYEVDGMVKKIKTQFRHIDILINNAGIFETQKTILDNGMEKNFMVNYLAPFYLTIHLLDLLKQSSKASIINVSSMIHASSIDFDNLMAEKYYSGESAYSLSKLCNILFTYKWSNDRQYSNININALHPGVINTKLLAAGWGPFGASTQEGAKRILYLCKLSISQNISGKYFENDHQTTSSAIAYDIEVQDRLWNLTNKLINLKN